MLVAISLWVNSGFQPRQASPRAEIDQPSFVGNEPEPLGEQAKNMFDLANVELDKARIHLEKASSYQLHENIEAACSEYIQASSDARRADFFVNVEYAAHEIQEKRAETVDKIHRLRNTVIAPQVVFCDKLGYTDSSL